MDSPALSRRRLAAMLALGLGTALPAAALARDLPDPQRGPLVETTKTSVDRRLTVQVLINDAGPYPFLVDTGANASVISKELAASLDLPRREPVTFHSIAGAELVETVGVDRISVGRRTRRGMRMSVLPERYIRGAGVLGLDWLGTQGLVLDFARRQMRLGSVVNRSDSLSVTVPVVAQRSGLHLIDASVVGASVMAFLDTGSTTTVGNLALMNQTQRRHAASRDWADIQLLSVTGQVLQGRLAALKSLELGNLKLGNVPVVFGPVHTFEYWGLVDKPAILIGVDVLDVFESVALDYTRGQVHFRLPSSSSNRQAALDAATS
ncbi:aspartyl protease [Caulobacter sp. Root1455]|uniref:retroviral-like aspartic protease family protein n=1 Tax=Caulobacter sp. Root1455 TaxID=1736465 RepID=UPI0006F3E837|nr:retroviral-like aspartic protease family protein [Caulobacter sp. Root1455]KQY92805.1 aspartyl protease [Caulobacter sp. Root1455]